MRVLVVGAGLSGMVLAAALKRAGIEVDVIELHASWQVLGVGISVQGPALRALKSIGLLERCLGAGFGYSQVVNCDQDGRVQGIVELPRLNGPQYPSCIGMMRPLLHEVVAGALAQAGVAVRFGHTVKALTQGAETVEVGFRSEEHTSELQSRFDLVCRLLLEKKKNNEHQVPHLHTTDMAEIAPLVKDAAKVAKTIIQARRDHGSPTRSKDRQEIVNTLTLTAP